MLILLSSFFIIGCQNRKKVLKISEFRSAQIEKIKKDSLSELKKTEQKKVQDKIKINQNEKTIDGHIEIKGKTDSLNNFHYHNIVDGDTLQDISIVGNSDFIIKNRYKSSEKKKDSVSEFYGLNIIQEVARKSVAQSTIKEVAKKVKSVDKNIKEKTFTFGAWMIWLIVILLIIAAVWAYYYFGGGFDIKGIWNRIFGNKTKD